jgi:serine/threonine protein phosphatase 1
MDRIILLGDYIDRGPNSRAVVNEIIHLRNRSYNIIPLRGNHEQMLIDTYYFPDNFLLWKRNGGEKTCSSFMIDDIKKMPKYYVDFFESLKFYYLLDDYVVVHGGLNFDIDDVFSDTEAMLWTRNSSVDKSKIGGRRLIVGHTPTELDNVAISLDSDIIKLDGGCAYKNSRNGMGALVAYEVEDNRLYFEENIDI